MEKFSTVAVADKKIGHGQPVYIVFEAGPTHDGLETAQKLVDVAVSAGADAVKFQILDAEQLVSSPGVNFTYTALVDKHTGETETVTESLLKILKRREMPREDWVTLIKYCRKKGIEFFSTATNEEELQFLADQRVSSVKICSGDVNYHDFIRRAAGYGFSIQLDTGSSSFGEIEAAVDIVEAVGNRQVILNHCPSGYPAGLGSINLRIISTLQSLFQYPVAFSDHSPGYEMDIAALALGASMIEKTITLDRTIRSPEHIMSLEPGEAGEFVRKIREMEIALGSSRRFLSESEKQKRLVGRRSLFTNRAMSRGEIISREEIRYARPGDGIPADLDSLVIGRKLRRDIPGSHKLGFEDLE